MTRLALLRHGHTPWNREGRIQGRTDIPLDDEARAHLGDLHLPDGFDHFDVVSSPLLRAFDTALLLASPEGGEPTCCCCEEDDEQRFSGVEG